MALLKKHFPLSTHLLALVLASMVPLFLFAAATANWLVRKERQASEQVLVKATEEIALIFDHEIDATIRSLNTLAAAESLERGALREFHSEVRRFLQVQPSWTTIVVHTSPENLAMSGDREFGAKPTPPIDPESLREIFQSGKPQVGRIVRGSAQSRFKGKYAFAVRVPIISNGKVRYALSALISADVIQSFVTRAPHEPDVWTRTIVDRTHVVAARSRSPEEFVGKSATPSFIRRTSETPQALVRETTLEGKSVYLSFLRAPISNWVISIAVPVETLEAQATKSGIYVVSIGLSLIFFFGGVALLYARRIARDLHAATAGASAVALGQTPQIVPSRVLEVEQLRSTLLEAAELLQSRERERNENLEKAQEARAEAEKASRAKSDFLANISHELRTPLGIVIGSLDLFAREDMSSDERISLLGRMQRNAEYLALLIDQVLDLSKVEAGALQIDHKDFSLAHLMSEIAESLEPSARAKGISLRFEYDGPPPEIVSTDPLRLRQIMVNLVGNAIKFTSHGGVTVMIRSLAPTVEDPDSGVLEFEIRDSGIGMTADQRETLFKPFSQGDTSITRRFGGTGLGLALSKKLARALGGDLELTYAEPEKGSIFTVRLKNHSSLRSVGLPLAAGAPSSGPVDSLASARRAEDAPLKGRKILLVDDSADNRYLIQRYLSSAGAEISEADNGRDGIDMALQNDFDCVLMDIQMPKLDGNQATAELRRLGYKKPIIALTAHAMKSDKEKAMSSGYNDYITKPVNRTLLIRTLAQLTDDSKPSDLSQG